MTDEARLYEVLKSKAGILFHELSYLCGTGGVYR